jgi:2-polyprenyl-3-methyl-5-hydroxy-6-metoxy-1,4-benzoquinol methylase
VTNQQKSMVGRARDRALWTGRDLKRRLKPKLALNRLTADSATRRAALRGPPDQWEVHRRVQFEFLTSHGLMPEHRLIDIGCGTLCGGVPLIEYLEAGNYTGVEARAEVLEEAHKELAEAGLENKRPSLIGAADPAQIELSAPFDVAWAFMVLIHMTDEIVEGYLQFVSDQMTENGVFYANVALGDHVHVAEWQGFPVLSRPREFYRRAASAHGLSVADMGTLASLSDRIGRGGETTMLRFTHTRQ